MRKRLGIRDIKALEPGQVIWDTAVTGFGARRQKGTAVVYFLFYRSVQSRQRWFTLGKHGSPWTPDSARTEARRLLGRVAAGEDPASTKEAHRKALTIAELCDQYIADAEAGRVLKRSGVAKKASTLAGDKSRIARHIKPLVGSLAVSAFTRQDAECLLHDIAAGKGATKGGKGVASRSLGLLGAIYAYAVRRGLQSNNPIHGTPRFADGRRERRLTDAEYGMLGEALRKAEKLAFWPSAIVATRFIALTGWRRSEALGLQWNELDLARRIARLGDTKTGRSIRPLSRAACDVLHGQPLGPNSLVFAAVRGKNGSDTFKRQFRRIAKLGGLPSDISAHTLRHSFVSVAADLGFSELIIAGMVGHKAPRSITAHYAHLSADRALLGAADATSNRIHKLMRV
jgi:integrase